MIDGAHQAEFISWLGSEAMAAEDRPAALAGVDRARLAVHRNTFVGTLIAALAESFPVTRALAGADFFDAMARERVLADPPISPVLTDYAISFPGFVHSFEPAAAAPVLAEMAQLEALRLGAFHSIDAVAIGHAQFHRLACDPDLLSRTFVHLHPAAGWLPARHPLLQLWQLHDSASDPFSLDLSGIDVTRGEDVLVHRPGYLVQMHALPPGAIAFLDALACAASFTQAFEEEVAASKQASPATLFSLLLEHGLVIELVELDTEHT